MDSVDSSSFQAAMMHQRISAHFDHALIFLCPTDQMVADNYIAFASDITYLFVKSA
jgi:hypothetical protein